MNKFIKCTTVYAIILFFTFSIILEKLYIIIWSKSRYIVSNLTKQRWIMFSIIVSNEMYV